MRKRLLAVIMSAVCCLGVAFSGCANPGNTGNGGNEQYAEYQLYLTYAAEHNETPLTYEEWLASVKGEKGDSGATGPQGPEGPQGETGPQGPEGPQGENGPAGRGIASMVIDENGHLIVTYTDSNLPIDLGKVVGEDGQNGQTGATGSTGATGATGAAGRGISSMTIDDNGHLIVVYTDSATPVDLGKVVGDSTGTSATPVNQWWTGTADPDSASGNDGDFYIDTDDFLLYKKESGEWIVILQKFGGKDTTQYYKNLFNKDDAETKYLSNINGNGVAVDVTYGSYSTHFIPVELDKQYLYKGTNEASNFGANYRNVYLYDANKNFVATIKATIIDENGSIASSSTDYANLNDDTLGFTLSSSTYSTVKYARFNIRNSSSWMLIQADTFPITYVAYGEKVVIPGTEDTSSGGGLTEAEKELLAQSNPLYMKKIGWEGDSICHAENANGGYAKLISSANSMESVNNGISGGTIANNVPNENGTCHSIVSGVSQLASNSTYDYIIFEGGVNDCSRGVTINAEAFDADDFSTAYIEALDIETFAGAYEKICSTLALSGKKVGYIFVHKIYNSSSKWATEYRPIMLKILEKWGIPYCDLENTIPPLNLNPTLKATYTVDSDGWHPNELGYKTFYIDKITAWLKTL